MKAAILGTGLMGASVGLALRGAGWQVVGWDPSPEARQAALDVGAIAELMTDPAEARNNSGLVVLAGPPHAIAESLKAMRNGGALVMDIGGVKEEIVAAGAHLDRFVGTHPMAGREHVGAAAASAALFRGAAWIVVSDGAAESDLIEVERVIELCGGVPVRMTAAEHDAAVARISHLPHVLSATLVSLAASDRHALDLAAGSFRDLTRVALSDPGMWTDVLLANRHPLAAMIDDLTERLHGWRAALESGDRTTISRELVTAQTVRRQLAPPIVAVRVFLEDQPGELAGVGRALAASQVDVRDLQLRHGEHGGGGVLTLSVRPGESEALKTALLHERFMLD